MQTTVASTPQATPMTQDTQTKEDFFTQRSHFCGDVTADQVSQTVTLNGWVAVNRDLGGLIFIEMRDRSGFFQIVADPEKNPQVHGILSGLKAETVITATGPVTRRPEDTYNPNLPTGEFEIYPTSVEVISRSKTLPFQLDDEADLVDEGLRLKHRYLDLRRPKMHQNFLLRHQVAQAIRNSLNSQGFLEIETPILLKATPEGARDYLVPSRVHPGQTFALPQSPQIFKQLLMVSGMERYYQIARCFRDEDLRADRQPEFTQVDLEMSFVNQEDVLSTVEDLLCQVFSVSGITLEKPFRRMPWQEAMEKYGSDKPDLRFGMEFIDLTDIFTTSEFSAFRQQVEKGGVVKALMVKGAASYSRKELDDLQVMAKRFGAKGLAYIVYNEDGPKSPILKFMSEAEQQAIQQRTGAETGDAVFFAADSFNAACAVLGRFRLLFGEKHNLIDKNRHEILWVTDFPMFEVDDAGNLSPNHHPFTSPRPQDLELLDTDPGKACSLGYDVVYNGAEIGGGSVRIHQRDLQAKIFKLLGLTDEEAHEKFGFLLEAFEYGVPPHGGLALGLDRIVAMLAGEDSIREVIAFPKTNNAACPLTSAPSAPSEEQLKELHMAWVLPEEEAEA